MKPSVLTAVPHYIASTCDDGDSISQWRAYSSLHDGYAIAFKRERFERIKLDIIRLQYEPKNQKEFLRRIVDTVTGAYEDADSADRSKILSAVFYSIQFCVHHMKDPSFSGEREWRLLDYDPLIEEKFRVVGGQIVPYKEIPIAPDDIDHIVQGPGNYRAASGAAVERFAASCGFEHIKMKTSSVPLG